MTEGDDAEVLREEYGLRPGMSPTDAGHVTDNVRHICGECGMEFRTWLGAYDHQEANCDESARIGYESGHSEQRLPEDTKLDWWVGEGDDIIRVTWEIFTAYQYSKRGWNVRLAEPVVGGPA